MKAITMIVGRTRVGSSLRCIGGLCNDGRSIRLLDPNADPSAHGHWPVSAPYQLGQVWELEFHDRPDITPPHVEDVMVTSSTLLGTQPDPRAVILARVKPWQGDASVLFGGALGYTGNHNGYVSVSRGVPDRSTWFWFPDKDLTLRSDGNHYDYPMKMFLGVTQQRGLDYVGEPPAPATIPANTLVRVSLARWWKPRDADDDFELRCYAQLSGWF